MVETRKARAVRLLSLLLGAVLFLAITSCATVPRSSVPSGPALAGLLPSDSFAYASLRVSRNVGLLSGVLQKSGLAKSIPISFVDRTQYLCTAVQRDPGGKNVYSLVAQGRYPIGLASWRLDWSRTWRRRTAGPVGWWEDPGTGTQVALPARNLLLSSNGALPEILRGLTEEPQSPLNPSIRSVFAQSDLAIYVPRINGTVPLIGMNANRFPVNSFYFSLNAVGPSAETYRGYGLFAMKSDRDARLFSVVFKLLIASATAGSDIGGFPLPLGGAQLSVDGATIRVDGIRIGRQELVDLISRIISGGKPSEPS